MRSGFRQVRRVSKANPARPSEGCDEPAEPPVIQDKFSRGMSEPVRWRETLSFPTTRIIRYNKPSKNKKQTAGKLKQNISKTQQY